MGQSRPSTPPSSIANYTVFQTTFGWWGIVGRDKLLRRIYCGYPTRSQLTDEIHLDLGEVSSAETRKREQDWYPELRQRLEKYARGGQDAFTDIQLELPPLTPFQRKVLQITRKIPIGKTISYGQLASKAGFPRAARAVGSVMASNRFPIIIPCHRVVASGGKMGGYTNPVGVPLKERLLLLEEEMSNSTP